MDTLAFLSSAIACLWHERMSSPATLERLRMRRLARLLHHAKARTRLGAERFSSFDARRAIDFRAFAPVTKDQMMRRFRDTVTDGAVDLLDVERHVGDPTAIGRLLLDRYIVATTSGTTGAVGHFITDRTSWARMSGAMFARILRHRLLRREVLRYTFGRRYRMAMVVAMGGHFISRLVSDFRPGAGKAFVDLRPFSVSDPLDRVVTALNRFRPHYLHGYPTFLELLAEERRAERLAIDPEFISLGSEPVSMHARTLLGRAFPNAEISETYGSTECLAMANQCRFGNLHENEDLCILEPIDAEGRAVSEGVDSDRVLVTNLSNFAQPIIRYVLSDSIRWTREPCPCGTSMRRISVRGRSDDTIHLLDASGRLRPHPPVPFEALFLGVPGLAQFQLVHETQNVLRVAFVPKEGARADDVGGILKERFDGFFRDRGLADTVHFEVVATNAIERTARGGKLRQIWNRVPRPPVDS